jgi:hypothetical protein
MNAQEIVNRLLEEVKTTYTPEEAEALGKRQGVNFDDIDPEQFRIGLEIEMEHADVIKGDEEVLARIVLAHLKEDGRYYTKLQAMEKGFKESMPLREKMENFDLEYFEFEADGQFYSGTASGHADIDVYRDEPNDSLYVDVDARVDHGDLVLQDAPETEWSGRIPYNELKAKFPPSVIDAFDRAVEQELQNIRAV